MSRDAKTGGNISRRRDVNTIGTPQQELKEVYSRKHYINRRADSSKGDMWNSRGRCGGGL
jgi:hypothetical protein